MIHYPTLAKRFVVALMLVALCTFPSQSNALAAFFTFKRDPPGRRVYCAWAQGIVLLLATGYGKSSEWVKRCPNPMLGPSVIKIRLFQEIEDIEL